MEYQNLLEFCDTGRQREVIQTIINNNGDQVAAAKVLGITERGVRKTSRLVKLKANKSSTLNHDSTVFPNLPDGYQIKGVSNMVENSLGKPMWVKTEKAALQQDRDMQVAAEVFASELPAREAKPFNEPDLDTDLIPWFNIGDGHIGMLAHDKEIGESFDLKIAEAELCEAMSVLIDRAPQTSRCVIQDVGDMTHFENYSGTTEASGHALDVDTRFHKMIEVYTRTMEFIVEKALSKYQYVDIIINQGNHSRTNDHWMGVMLRALYRNEHRLHVLPNVSIFTPYRMGNTFVMCHHFDKCKPAQAAGVMANDFAQDWGETKYHYVDGGHVHSNHQRTEVNGCVTESFNQIAAADKYAHDAGWRSRKCLTVVLRSKTYGETGRLMVSAEEIKDRIMALEPGTTAKKRREVYTV
ncbi:DNA repair exonuclease [Vibrio phage K359]